MQTLHRWPQLTKMFTFLMISDIYAFIHRSWFVINGNVFITPSTYQLGELLQSSYTRLAPSFPGKENHNNVNRKLYWVHRAKIDRFVHRRFNRGFTLASNFSIGCEHFPCHYSHSWEHADSCCSTSRVFPSSAIQTLASLSGYNWSVRWSYLPATLCCFLDLNCGQKLDFLPIIQYSVFYG